MKGPMRLRKRILLVVSGLAFGISLIFSLYTVVFIYAVEDAFFNAALDEEAARQAVTHARTGQWGQPRDPRVTLMASVADLPAGIGKVLAEEPARVEFPGPGNSHYHIRQLSGANGERAWLVHDVGQQLVVQPMQGKLVWLLVVTMLVLLAVSLAAGYWASRRTTRRLDDLAAAVAGLDPTRLRDSWLDSTGDDEVGVVANGLEAMSHRLRAFIERERSFTRDASHELRTPLAVMRSAGEQLAKEPELSERARQHADLIRDSTTRLEQTVSMLLIMAQEGSIEDEGTSVTLLPLIEQVIVDQAPRLEGKPVGVDVDVPQSVRLRAPEAVARILLANLIGNAFAHTSAGTVRVDTRNERLRIVNPLTYELQEIGDDLLGARGASEDGFGFGLGIVHRLCDRFRLAFEIQVDGPCVVATLPIEGGSDNSV